MYKGNATILNDVFTLRVAPIVAAFICRVAIGGCVRAGARVLGLLEMRAGRKTGYGYLVANQPSGRVCIFTSVVIVVVSAASAAWTIDNWRRLFFFLCVCVCSFVCSFVCLFASCAQRPIQCWRTLCPVPHTFAPSPFSKESQKR